MRPLIQIPRPSEGPQRFERDEDVAMPLVRLDRATRERNDDTMLARRLDRIDALKILIRSLLQQLDDLTEPDAPADGPDLSLQTLVRRFETELIRHALLRTGGKQRQAARLLGEKKTTLNAKIIRYGIRVDRLDNQSTNSGS